MRVTFLTTAVLLMSLTFASCDKEQGDTTKPTILLEGPAEGGTLKVGHHVHFEMELTDDVALGSYKVEIHNNFDGHSHSKATKAHDHKEPFAYNKEWNDIAGKRNAHIHHHEIEIPSDVALGNYHFIVYCSDAAGNETQVARNIKIAEK